MAKRRSPETSESYPTPILDAHTRFVDADFVSHQQSNIDRIVATFSAAQIPSGPDSRLDLASNLLEDLGYLRKSKLGQFAMEYERVEERVISANDDDRHTYVNVTMDLADAGDPAINTLLSSVLAFSKKDTQRAQLAVSELAIITRTVALLIQADAGLPQ